MHVTKAIIPVAGYGTRRLPVSKALEKCMLPVLNRPIVDYIVQDCIAAGITEFYFVINEDARQLREFYGRSPALEGYLRDKHKDNLLPLVTPPAGITFNFVQQPLNEYGTTVPVYLCRDFIEPEEKVLVVMGDQFFFNPDGRSEALSFLQRAGTAGAPSAMLAAAVPDEEVSKYGIVMLHVEGDRELYEQIIEKPSVEDAPSNLSNGSFYLFDHGIFAFIEAGMQKLHDGELMITDVINSYVQAGNEVAVIRNQGEYLDCGTVEGWLYANNRVFTTVQK